MSYPDDGKVELKVSADRPAAFTVRVRLPNRAESALYAAKPEVSHGHQDFTVALTQQSDGSISSKSIRFELPMPLQRVTCDKRVKANRGLVAWQRGPIVFSWEGPGFTERVPYWLRLNAGGPSRVWIPADGSTPTAETVAGEWFRGTGCPLDANNRKVTSSCFLKER